MAFCNFVNIRPHGAGNFKTLLPLQFLSNFNQLYEDIGYHCGIHIYMLAISPVLNLFVALWNFNMGVNGKFVNCAVSGKRLTVEWNGWKFGNRSPIQGISRGFDWGLGHSVHFAKFTMLRLSNGYCSHSFHPISTKLYGKNGNYGGIGAITFFAICQILNILWHFEIFDNKGPYETGNFKMLLPL